MALHYGDRPYPARTTSPGPLFSPRTTSPGPLFSPRTTSPDPLFSTPFSPHFSLLAEVRQQQDRWSEAATQWEQVTRIRALEPTGLLKLASAQIHLCQWDQATQTLRKVGARTWPPRFGEVRNEIRQMETRITAGRQESKKN